MCNVVRHFDRRMWGRCAALVVLALATAAVVYAQEPITTIGLPVAGQTTWVERWIRPESITMFALTIVWAVDVRGRVKGLEDDVRELKTFTKEFPRELEQKYMTTREVESRFREHQRFIKRGQDE